MPMSSKKAVVLLSGGLDSATCLWWARAKGYTPIALSVAYGQRHSKEIVSARKLARLARAEFHVLRLDLPWLRCSSLMDAGKALPNIPLRKIGKGGIPSTYVPGRNAVFLALAASLADAAGAEAVVIGANALDYSGYPDCRPKFLSAFQKAVSAGTKQGSQGKGLRVLTPLLHLDKAAIVRLAGRLGVPLQWTWSCYKGSCRPCGACDSCKLRAKGFEQAGLLDPA